MHGAPFGGFARYSRIEEAGFTLIEVVVAMGILLITMAALSGLYVSAYRTLSASGERHTASNLAQESLEALRALPYSVAQQGGTQASVATDVTSPPFGKQSVFGSTAPYRLMSPSGEAINSLGLPEAAPPFPLTPSPPTQRDNTTFEVRTYVSGAVANNLPVLHGTAIVTWQAANGRGVQQYVAQTSLTSDVGCESGSTHPFEGPCQNFLYAAAGLGQTNVSVTTDAGPQPLVGSAELAQLQLGAAEASTQGEQTSSSAAFATFPWPYAATTAGAAINPAAPLSAGADSDPSGTLGPYSAPPASSAPVATSKGSGAGNLIATTTSTAGSGQVTASVAGVGCQLPNATGTLPAASPCAAAHSSTAQMEISVTLNGGAGALMLAHIDAPGAASEVVAGRETTTTASLCTASDVAIGCAGARARRVLPSMYFAGLVASTGTASALYKVDPMVEDLWAESGPGSSNHAATRLNGTISPNLSYRSTANGPWTAVALDGSTASKTALTALPTVTYAATYQGRQVTVTVDPDFRTGAVSPTPADVCTATCKRQMTSSAALSGTVAYTLVDTASTILAQFTISVDYGQAAATSAFQVAPSAN